MNKRETVQALVDSVQRGDFEAAKSMLADDFQASGFTSAPIDKETWLGMSANLKAAFPDLDYHFKVIGAQGDVVRTTMQLSGTRHDAFDLTNMGAIPATDKTFDARLEKAKVTVKGTKVTAWIVEPTQGAGLMSILGQLDAKPAI